MNMDIPSGTSWFGERSRALFVQQPLFVNNLHIRSGLIFSRALSCDKSSHAQSPVIIIGWLPLHIVVNVLFAGRTLPRMIAGFLRLHVNTDRSFHPARAPVTRAVVYFSGHLISLAGSIWRKIEDSKLSWFKSELYKTRCQAASMKCWTSNSTVWSLQKTPGLRRLEVLPRCSTVWYHFDFVCGVIVVEYYAPYSFHARFPDNFSVLTAFLKRILSSLRARRFYKEQHRRKKCLTHMASEEFLQTTVQFVMGALCILMD